MIFYKDRSYQLNIECNQNFVIDFWGGSKYLEGGGGQNIIRYLTPGSSWDSFWYCQNKSILTIQEIIDIILI